MLFFYVLASASPPQHASEDVFTPMILLIFLFFPIWLFTFLAGVWPRAGVFIVMLLASTLCGAAVAGIVVHARIGQLFDNENFVGFTLLLCYGASIIAAASHYLNAVLGSRLATTR
ncbi:MAG: hypothetical protein AAGA68_04355 [Pseudomonadota bacterium]